jgi:hypothetical protein
MKEILTYVVLGLLAHTFILVPLLMGLALNEKKHRDETGKLIFRKESFVLQRIYCCDIDEMLCLGRGESPKNICQLYWGIFWGILLRVPINVVIRLVYIIAFIVWHSGAIFFGFWPKGNWKFHPYKKCGWNSEQKVLLLPWELAALFLLIFTITESVSIINIARQALNNPITIVIGIMAASSVVFVLFWYLIGLSVEKIENRWGAPFKEFIKAKKQKWCPQINVK